MTITRSSTPADGPRTAIALAAALPVPAGGAAPDTIKLLDSGVNGPPGGGGPWHLADAAAVATASMAAGHPLPIDRDHAIDRAAPVGLPAPAVGWMTGMEGRADGLYARVEWGPEGAKALADRAYRFISPAFQYDPGTKKVLAVLRASLTNNPLFTNLPALADAAGDGGIMTLLAQLRPVLGLADAADDAAALAAVKAAVDKAKAADAAAGTALVALADAAGLPATATADQVVAAVKGLRGQQPAVALLQAQLAKLETEVAAGRTRARDERVAKLMAEGRITPAEKEHAVALADANPTLFEGIFGARPPVVAPGVAPGVALADAAGALTDIERQTVKALGLTEDKFRAAKGG